MKAIISILFGSFFCVLVFGQVAKQINIPLYKNGDTSLWYKWNDKNENNLNLERLETSLDTFHFRLWLNGQVVDVWTNNYRTFFGAITSFTSTYEAYNSKKEKQDPQKTYVTKTQIDTSLARTCFELIKTISIIPSEDSIKGWGNGDDGINYIFEMSSPTLYSFKSYWTPTAQDSSLIEAKKIQTFIDTISHDLNLNEERTKFNNTLPAGCYSTDGFMIMCILTDKQRKKLNRDIKRHPQRYSGN